ncbi:MAG: thioredoxin family protein [Atribacterota bacterium]|jgi:thioredoxin 1|nr:thioredoxin family protein [Atribacterota bacterium]
MKNKKLILILSIVLISLAIFGFKTIFNNSPSETKEISQKEKISSDSEVKVTFLELGSVGCIPCDKMQPILEEIAEEYKGQVEVVFHDVKTPEGKPYVQEYKVRAIPTQVFLDQDGNEYFRHLGFFPKEEVVKVLQQQGVK